MDAASGWRGNDWANLFTPRTRAFDLSARPLLPGGASRPAETLLSWWGLDGDSLGGMAPRTAEPVLWHNPYDFAAHLDAMSGLPVQVGATKPLCVRWRAQTANPLPAELTDEGWYLSGRLPTDPLPLTHCLLAYRHWAYELGTLGAGRDENGRAVEQVYQSENAIDGNEVHWSKGTPRPRGGHALRPRAWRSLTSCKC